MTLFWKFSWWVPVPSFSWSPQEPSVGSFRDLVNSQHLFRNQHSLNCIFLNLSCYKKKIVCYRFDDWLTFLFLGLLYAELSGLGPENIGTSYQMVVGHLAAWGSCHHGQQGWLVLVRQVESCQSLLWTTELVLGHFYLCYCQCRIHSSLDSV